MAGPLVAATYAWPVLPLLVIAIDGPSGSGKSSVSRAIARRYGLGYLDTGAMYRALAWWHLQGQTDMSTCPLVVSTDPDVIDVHVGDVDVTEAIRGPEVSAAVSQVAADATVRAQAVSLQRQLIAGAERGIVVEGRDITTVVAPDAEVRIFLTADLAAREARRAAEVTGDTETVEALRAAVAARDAVDSTRTHSPLRKAAGVTEIDATHMTLQEVIDAVAALVDEALEARA